jgi:hypothetical protein
MLGCTIEKLWVSARRAVRQCSLVRVGVSLRGFAPVGVSMVSGCLYWRALVVWRSRGGGATASQFDAVSPRCVVEEQGSESLAELETKLKTYKEQLLQVDQLLAGDPSSEQFSKLRSDLLEVIELTQNLVGAELHVLHPRGSVLRSPPCTKRTNRHARTHIVVGAPLNWPSALATYR